METAEALTATLRVLKVRPVSRAITLLRGSRPIRSQLVKGRHHCMNQQSKKTTVGLEMTAQTMEHQMILCTQCKSRIHRLNMARHSFLNYPLFIPMLHLKYTKSDLQLAYQCDHFFNIVIYNFCSHI